MEETWVPGENHLPAASHWGALSHNDVSMIPWTGFEITTLVVIGTDCIGSVDMYPTTYVFKLCTDIPVVVYLPNAYFHRYIAFRYKFELMFI